MPSTVVFDHQDPAFVRDPYPVLHRLIAEAPPVFWSEGMRAWVVTGYDDVKMAFRHPKMSADRIAPFVATLTGELRETVQPLGDMLSLWAVFNDPPTHTRLRGLMNKAFTSRAIEALRPAVAALVNELLDAIEALPGREFDYTRMFAYPLPASVIGDMLGVPRGDVDNLKRWSDDLAQFVLTSRANPEKYRRAAEGAREMTAYFRDFVAERERQIARGTARDDVTTGLVKASDRESGFTPAELVSNTLLLLFAGHETTTQLLANGLLALLRHPDQMADLRAHLDDAALVRNAVEEMLRYDGPALTSVRVASEDFEWRGAAIRKGQRLFLFHAAANRDSRVFPDPDKFDIRRADAKNNVAFGYGIHFCLGAPLARLEGEIAFPLVLKRFPGLELAERDPVWSDSILTRGMHGLKVRR